MTSLEHSESASDYDPEHWDMGGQWGEIGGGSNSPSQPNPHSSSSGGPLEALCETDGWDNEEWGTLEEEPVRFLFNEYILYVSSNVMGF